MNKATYITSNDIKFNAAAHALAAHGITLERERLDFIELQGLDGEPIVRHKADQAFTSLQRAVIVSDDTWQIPGLGGFPGPYMKDINEWLSAADLLRLVEPLTDRRIILQQHAIYQDADGQHYFVQDIIGSLLTKASGSSKSSILEITSFDDSLKSHAERLAAGEPNIPTDKPTVWSQVADWLGQH